jgi:hypothetical protein
VRSSALGDGSKLDLSAFTFQKKNTDLTDETVFRGFDFIKKEHGCG